MSRPNPLELSLGLVPRARVDIVDPRASLSSDERAALKPYARCLYWSSHTTAGFLERALAARLLKRRATAGYLDAFRAIFPEGVGYEHDRLDQRTELAPEQRLIEPRNADSHLAFIAAGLRTCVSFPNRAAEPVRFVDLDGMHSGQPRQRLTRIIGYQREEELERVRIEVTMSAHPVDSINLKDPRLGIYEKLNALIARHDVTKGRLRLVLDHGERHAGLTVNEYETLLMRHDLAEVLRNPLRFAALQARNALKDVRAVPIKTLGYAKYDLVRVVNQVVDALGLRESVVERLVARALAAPAARFLRMKRRVELLVSDPSGDGRGTLIEGTYQSPILVQWHRAPHQARFLDVTLTRLR
ncbi:MAG: hypothetical protein ACRD1S_16690 [Vicinamibacterales bacterium]